MLKSLPFIPFLLSGFSFMTLANEHENNNVMVPAFNAKYTIFHNSKPVGEATRQLQYLEDGLTQYSYHTNLEWLIFSDTRQETSILAIDKGHISPTSYEFSREGTGSDKHYKWSYDLANNTATNELKQKSKTIDFPDNIQDKLSYHLQHRFNMIANPQQKHFVYPVISTSGKIKNYVYQYDGEEELMLPYGLVNTIRLKREVVEKKRITYAWFAPELNYLLVKLYQTKAGAEQFEAQLNTLNDKQKTPLKQ